MRKFRLAAVSAAIVASVLFSASASAVPPTNPSFEDIPDLDTWTVADIGDVTGTGWVVRGADATDGDAFGRLGFLAYVDSYATAYGPAFRSADFTAGTGEELSLDWRVRAMGGHYCADNGDPSTGDFGLGRGYLVDASTDLVVETFFDTEPVPCNMPWETSSLIVPTLGEYYLVLQVGSYDETGGGVIGAQLDVDNVISSNLPPDCSEAYAEPDKLWPPNHMFWDIGILGVTDPEGDSFEIAVTSVFQDEFTNTANDGDTCPDATGIGTDTASVMAERYGGEFGYEGDGRMYHINFSATDEYGASCTGTVEVGVPHAKKEPVGDQGPLFDSTVCP